MKKNLRWVVFALSFAGMGIAMPSCPGQEALQQQVDSLKTSNLELTKKVQNLQSQVTTLNQDMDQVKKLLPTMTNVITSYQGAIKRMDDDIKNIQSRLPRGGMKKKR